jgi:hypothetical protein
VSRDVRAVIVAIDGAGEASDLLTRKRRDLAGLADRIDDLVPA